jgi:hypothetical protein
MFLEKLRELNAKPIIRAQLQLINNLTEKEYTTELREILLD